MCKVPSHCFWEAPSATEGEIEIKPQAETKPLEKGVLCRPFFPPP